MNLNKDKGARRGMRKFPTRNLANYIMEKAKFLQCNVWKIFCRVHSAEKFLENFLKISRNRKKKKKVYLTLLPFLSRSCGPLRERIRNAMYAGIISMRLREVVEKRKMKGG